MLAISIILFNIFLLKFHSAEWVDMPQFSDETKVYRISTPRQDHFHKFTKQSAEDQFSQVYQNVTYKDIQTEQITDNDSAEHSFYKIKDAFIEPILQTPSKKVENIINTQYDEATIPLNTKTEQSKKEYFNESLISNGEEILRYLPVDTLKSVHQTLKLQPTSSQGKIQYLKMFENTLIAEIESRLAQTVMATREKRGVEHYDHGYDNEHAAGFPSIEGALMAISFLTFAVYLIRLVMLLFRNMNNPVTTTTGATLLLGRRKRSTNRFDDELAMIFKNIDNFSFES